MPILRRSQRDILTLTDGWDTCMLGLLGEVQAAEAGDFASRARVAARWWAWRDHVWDTAIGQPAGIALRRGGDLLRWMRVAHESYQQALENLDHSWSGSSTAAREEIAALRVELVRLMRRERRKLLVPLVRQMTQAERKELLRTLLGVRPVEPPGREPSSSESTHLEVS